MGKPRIYGTASGYIPNSQQDRRKRHSTEINPWRTPLATGFATNGSGCRKRKWSGS